MTKILLLFSLLITLLLIGFLIDVFNNHIIVRKTKFIISKIKQFIEFSQRKHFFYPLLFISIYLGISILYLILAYPQTLIDFDIYDISLIGTNAAKEIERNAKAFVLNMNNVSSIVFGFIGIILLILITLYLFRRKKLNFANGLILIIIVSSIIRIAYGFVTDNIFTRQHDTFSTNYNGHYGITMHLFETFLPPELINGSLDASYQFYHPKMSHYIFAFVMHFNSLFIRGETSFTLYESIRIFTITVSIFEVIMTYHILKILSKDNKIISLVGTFFMGVSPLFIRLSSMSNNDPLLYFFMIMSLLFALRFYKTFKWSDIIITAIAIGLATGSKISGIIIALPVALIFIFAIIKFIKTQGLKPFYKLIIKYGIFLIICVPIALFWPIYQKIAYNQDLFYLWTSLNKNLLVDPSYTYVDRFLSFPIDSYFNNIFVTLWASDRPYQDYNIYTTMLKSSIFGEFSYGNINTIFASFLSGANFILVVGIMLIGLYEIIDKIVKKKYVTAIILVAPICFYLGFAMEHTVLKVIMWIITLILIVYACIKYKETMKYKSHILMSIIVLMMMIVYLNLQINTPYTCSMDYRYIGLLSLAGAYFIGVAFDKANKSKHRTTLLTIYSSVLIAYGLGSTLLYISLGIY